MRKSRLSQYKQNKLIELFVAGVTARTAVELVGVNKNTAAYYFHRLRLLIYQNSPHLEMFHKVRCIRALEAKWQDLYGYCTEYSNHYFIAYYP